MEIDYAELALEKQKLLFPERFCENVYYLILGNSQSEGLLKSDVPERSDNQFQYASYIHGNWVFGNMQDCLIVTIKFHRFIREYP